MSPQRLPTALVFVLGLSGMIGCEDEMVSAPRPSNSAQSAAAKAVANADSTTPRLAVIAYKDEDFVESERNRDPFRAHLGAGDAAEVTAVSQRRVVMPSTAIESMRLIAIITGTPRPRAMILDPADVGHVVERGMFIGRPQVVQASGNVAMTLNWRVDRIRDNEVVLSRQDPTAPSRAPLIRVIPLHEEIAQR